MNAGDTGVKQIARFNHLLMMTSSKPLTVFGGLTLLICKERMIALPRDMRQGYLFEQREQLMRGRVCLSE